MQIEGYGKYNRAIGNSKTRVGRTHAQFRDDGGNSLSELENR
jgi:hypothetical protein